MSRAFHEFSFTAPLSTPATLDAYRAPADGDWRLIVIPGTPCRKALYKRMLRNTPADLEMIVITRPGYGRGETKAILDWDEQVRAVEPFLGEKKTIVMGVSYGGELALKTALDYPGEVHGVVTLSALINEPLDYNLFLERLGHAPIVRSILPSRIARMRDEIVGRRAQIGPLLDRLGDLTAPVEVVHGDADHLVARSDADTLMAHLGDRGRLEIVSGGTHFIELQFPKRTHAAVQRAIARAESGAPHIVTDRTKRYA